MRPAFLVTIDTEGDDQWRRPSGTQTRNARFLPRFQQLCETHGLRPTYLTNHEMALDPDFTRLAQDAVDAGTAEVGMHLHAWSSPPRHPLDGDGMHHPYLVEYPADAMAQKVDAMTDLLTERFGRPRSHRAGRWAFDGRYARVLHERGYTSDCSVTPHVDWSHHAGAPGGGGGTDYRGFPEQPYFLDLDDVRRAGASRLLEVPMTTRLATPLVPVAAVAGALGGRARRLRGRLVRWLRPDGRNGAALLRMASAVARRGEPCAMFMLHSSELMPGGSPTFRDEASVEALYRDLDALFGHARRLGFEGATMTGFRARYGGGA